MSIYEKALSALDAYKRDKTLPLEHDEQLTYQLDALAEELQSEIDSARYALDEIENFNGVWIARMTKEGK